MFLAKSYCDIGNSQSSSSTVVQDGEITTTFEYVGIQRLVRVTDTEGNVTKSVYDMGDRRTEVNHPVSGKTSFTYDPQRRRLQNLTVNSGGSTIMDNAYTYDAVSNVLSVVNGASVPQSGKAGGQIGSKIKMTAMGDAIRRKLHLQKSHAIAFYICRTILFVYIVATAMFLVAFGYKGNNLQPVCAQTVHDCCSRTHIYYI